MSMRLLVVDDETPVLMALTTMLEPLSSDIVAVSDSQVAADYLQNQKFDGVLVDVKMPVLDGFELTKKVRSSSLNSKIPVVMLTGLDDVDTMRKGFSAGATCFLGKPITRERIQSLMNAMRGPLLQERRRSARLPFRTKVECSVGNYGDKKFVGESVNIGEGGMLIEPSGGLEVNQDVTLEFRTPASDKGLRIRSRVVRREASDRIAVEFLDLAVRDRESIQSYIVGQLQG